MVNKVPGDYLDVVSLPWKLTRSMNHGVEPILLNAADDESAFLQTIQQTGIGKRADGNKRNKSVGDLALLE